jgi:riboflavin kinase/FMN adenylyltransferase
MNIYTEHFPQIDGPFAVCIGKFDGLHIGHRLILDTLLEDARRRGLVSVVYSFEPYNGAPRLTTREEKQALFGALGIDRLIVAELTAEFMAMSAERFIERLAACGELRAVAVGRDFRFGRGAAGDVALLKRLGAGMGFAVHAVEPVTLGGAPVSSTAIRDAVAAGGVGPASLMLGREYALTGEVVRGRELARRLGYNTANMLPPPGKVMPANGVYAAYADVDGRAWPAMTNIGVKPTVNGSELLIESHLLGFEGELYGQTLTVRLVKRIRDEIKFENVDKLAEQLKKDREQVRQILT